MSKKIVSDSLEKEDILRAVLVADDFDEILSPFVSGNSSVFLPLTSKKILNYALEWLSHSGIQETILFCSSKTDAIKEYIRTSQWNKDGSMKIVVMVSERCMSLGDALRDIDNKAVIKSDFILLSTSTVANFQLEDILQNHKAQCKKDRGTAMTLILQDRGCVSRGKETIVAINTETNRLLLYSKDGIGSKIQLSMECIAEHPQLTLHSTLKDTGIAICSPSVPLLFTDNFDFQTKEDFIRGLLLNEEVLASSIYCHVTAGYGATIQDWPSYQRVSLDVMHRWTFPLVPDVQFGQEQPLVHHRGCVYKHPNVNLPKGCKLDMDVVIGKDCTFGTNIRLLRSVIGVGCSIGDNVVIQDSFLLDNVTVSAGAHIALSVLGDNVQVGLNSKLKNCMVQHAVVLDNGTVRQDSIIASKRLDDSSEKLLILSKAGSDSESEGGVTDAPPWLLDPDAVSDEEECVSSGSDSDESRPPSPEADDCGLFYSEVVDSLQRGYEERLPCSNLILEVNSSRYAYNVTLSEVTQLMCKAVFALPTRLACPAKPLLAYFKPLFANYVKTVEGQVECLSAFEELHEGLGNEINSCLHFLYDADVLTEDVIINWHGRLKDSDVLKSKLTKFVNWLEEAAEESDEE